MRLSVLDVLNMRYQTTKVARLGKAFGYLNLEFRGKVRHTDKNLGIIKL